MRLFPFKKTSFLNILQWIGKKSAPQAKFFKMLIQLGPKMDENYFCQIREINFTIGTQKLCRIRGGVELGSVELGKDKYIAFIAS